MSIVVPISNIHLGFSLMRESIKHARQQLNIQANTQRKQRNISKLRNINRASTIKYIRRF